MQIFENYKKIGLNLNPFSVEPLFNSDVERFMVGREREIKLCYREIANRNNILIYGLKGMGKTTLLNYLKVKLKEENVIVAYFNMPSSVRQFLLSLLSSLIKDNDEPTNIDATLYHRILKDVDRYSKSPASLPVISLERYIEKYIQMFSTDFPIVVLIDELHSITKKTDVYLNSYLCTYLFKENFIFVASGLTTFYKPNEPTISALRDRFPTQIPLNPLSDKEIEEMIYKRLQSAMIEENSFNFPENILELVCEYSQGNPRVVMILCKDLVDMFAEGYPLNKDTFTKIAKNHNLLYSQRLLDGLNERTREVYRLILKYSPTTPSKLSAITNLSPQNLHYHFNILYMNGLIKKINKPPRTVYIPSEEVEENKW